MNRMSPPVPSPSRERNRFILACVAIGLLCVSLKLPSLFFEHEETDERVFWSLAENLLHNGTYSLRGSSLLPLLSAHVYDRPLYHHPPLYAVTLMPFVASKAERAAVMVSWLGHLLALVGVAMAAWSCRRRAWGGCQFGLWLPVLAMALDPLLSFCGRKLWADALVGGLVSLAMGCWTIAARRASIRWVAAGGVTMALASLTKLPALFVLPAGAVLLGWAGRGTLRDAVRFMFIGLGPAVLSAGSWLVVFRFKCGAWLASWSRPDQTMIELNSFVRKAMEQPWHFYFGESLMVAPVIVVVILGALIAWRRSSRSPEVWASLLWLLVCVVMLTLWGVSGAGMRLRYLAIAFPAMYVLMARLLAWQHPRRSAFPLLCILMVSYAAACTGTYLISGKSDEIGAVPRFIWQLMQRDS